MSLLFKPGACFSVVFFVVCNVDVSIGFTGVGVLVDPFALFVISSELQR